MAKIKMTKFLGAYLASLALAAPVDWSTVDYSGVDWASITQNQPFFVLWGAAALVTDRIDPIESPGQALSQHMHQFVGSNAISSSMQQSSLLSQTTCSTFQMVADKSSYWTPALYFQDPKSGTFTLVPEKAGFRKMYYSYKTADGQLDTAISEYPEGLQMLAGDPHTTSQAAVTDCANAECGYHQMSNSKAVTWQCLDSGVTSVGFPTGLSGCKSGLNVRLMFPTCWNGNKFDSKNPHAHVAMSTGDGIEGCPNGFRVKKFPQLFGEVTYDVSAFSWAASDSPFVLSHGDKTGFGWHMDFMNGWEPGALDTVMKTCRKGDGSNPSTLAGSDCFGQVGGVWSADAMKGCTAQAPITKRDVSITALPGCQSLWTEGSTPNLEICADTTTTTDNGVPDSQAMAQSSTTQSSTVSAAASSTLSTVVQQQSPVPSSGASLLQTPSISTSGSDDVAAAKEILEAISSAVVTSIQDGFVTEVNA